MYSTAATGRDVSNVHMSIDAIGIWKIVKSFQIVTNSVSTCMKGKYGCSTVMVGPTLFRSRYCPSEVQVKEL